MLLPKATANNPVRWLRWLLCRLLGPPVCPTCSAYRWPCIRRCGVTDAERTRQYIAGRSRWSG